MCILVTDTKKQCKTPSTDFSRTLKYILGFCGVEREIMSWWL